MDEEVKHEEVIPDILPEWGLERVMIPLPPLCDLCGGDATDGQRTVEGILCVDCIRK